MGLSKKENRNNGIGDDELRLDSKKYNQAGGTVETIRVEMLPDGRMDTTNAAKYLGVSEKTLAMQRCSGTGPEFIKMGKVFYYKDDLDVYVSTHKRVKTTAEVRLIK